VIVIVVVDDHPVVRDGLRALLSSVEGLRVAATAGDGNEAVRAALEHRPDVVLMDVHMPGADGIEATRRIVTTLPDTKVLMLTMFDDDSSVIAALRAGASGYLLKGASQEEIFRAIQAVAAGEALLSAAVAKRVMAHLNQPEEKLPRESVRGLVDLTPREREILDLLAAGRSNHAIARRLYISPKTVANHLSSVFAKLHVEGRTQAVILARQAGLGKE
jgi:DNA-binding NarL/FixJ family response regulator